MPFRYLLTALFLLIWQTAITDCRAEKIPVAVSIFPVADMVRQVGGAHIDITVVIPAGASPHTFEPKPSQVKKISRSKLFFMIGAGLEKWLAKFFSGSGIQPVKVILSEGVALIHTNVHLHNDPDQADSRGAVTVSERPPTGTAVANPHIWLDPMIAKFMTGKIITAFSKFDAGHKNEYEQNGGMFIEALEALDQQIRRTVKKFRIKQFVAFHPAWDYFARRYGLDSVGIIESAPGKNPTPKKIQQIVSDIKRYQIRAIFAEPQLNPKVAQVIAKEAGVKVLLLDPMGGPHVKGRSSYIDLMDYNLNILKEAMQ